MKYFKVKQEKCSTHKNQVDKLKNPFDEQGNVINDSLGGHK